MSEISGSHIDEYVETAVFWDAASCSLIDTGSSIAPKVIIRPRVLYEGSVGPYYQSIETRILATEL